MPEHVTLPSRGGWDPSYIKTWRIRPSLDPTQLQEILWATARRDGATGDGDEEGWDARWEGAGKLDVGAAAELPGFGVAPYALFLPVVGGL